MIGESRPLSISVVICTFNRCEKLAQCLLQISKLDIPSNVQMSVLIVDNNSTDGTGAIVDKFRETLSIEYVVEKEAGVSNARNRGLDFSTSDYTAWIDDDVIVPEYWLRVYSNAIAALPQVSIFGGPVLSHFVSSPPAWVQRNINYLNGPFSLLPSVTLGPIAEGHYPYSGNMLIKTSVMKKFRFNSSVGRVGRLPIGGEDVLYCRNLLEQGNMGFWLPQARVFHIIDLDRCNLAYIKKWYYFSGLLACLTTASDLRGLSITEFLGVVSKNFLSSSQTSLFFRGAYWLRTVKLWSFLSAIFDYFRGRVDFPLKG
jgi:glucosyl-dolichyl phosphate glucuronosyltransferase